MRVFLVVLDSVGIGEAPDADAYGDAGSNTLAHAADAAQGLRLPTLATLGLGNIPALLPKGLPIRGVDPVVSPDGWFGAMQEVSIGKDTTTGHWEMAGLELDHGFHIFPAGPPSFPDELLDEFQKRTGRAAIGNRAASGTRIIEELGERQMAEGCWIVYTSGDSVFQIAAHEDVIPLPELYHGCEIARELCDPYRVGRVIARPYIGVPGHFTRTQNRRDFSYPMPEPTILDRVAEAGHPSVTIGKLDDIFAGCRITESFHVENSADAMRAVLELAATREDGLFFANLIDFDMLYGHRRDPIGYAHALEEADRFVSELLPRLREDDVLMITADHGNDPTFRGTDHCREFVPLLVYHPASVPGGSLGIRVGFYDVAQTIAACFGLAAMPRGRAFWPLRKARDV